jgi:chitin synthase
MWRNRRPEGKVGQYLLNPLVAAHYTAVSSGTFSAYRYIAPPNDQMGEGPLRKYFLGEKMARCGHGHFHGKRVPH